MANHRQSGVHVKFNDMIISEVKTAVSVIVPCNKKDDDRLSGPTVVPILVPIRDLNTFSPE